MEDLSDQSKLFVGGVSWETTEETLTEHFSRYGTVVGSVIAKDRATGSPRGFAFVSFSDPAAVDLALQDSHDILGRTVSSFLASLIFCSIFYLFFGNIFYLFFCLALVICC
jgi:RNA recognition motif-containing protein